jgi:hypothetical protein
MGDSAEENLAGLIERFASIELQIGELSAALRAVRLTLAEIGPAFERRFAKHFAEPGIQQVLRDAAAARKRLLEIARKLRDQA